MINSYRTGPGVTTVVCPLHSARRIEESKARLPCESGNELTNKLLHSCCSLEERRTTPSTLCEQLITQTKPGKARIKMSFPRCFRPMLLSPLIESPITVIASLFVACDIALWIVANGRQSVPSPRVSEPGAVHGPVPSPAAPSNSSDRRRRLVFVETLELT
jgi:hypothetical protein